MDSDSISPSLACAHMHSIARAQKTLTFMSKTAGGMPSTETDLACTIHEDGM